MRSTTYIALLASAVAAQESASVLVVLPLGTSITYVTSDATATTFANICPSGAAGIPIPNESEFPQASQPADITLTPMPAPTGFRVRRQDPSTEGVGLSELWCEPYTLIQGPNTYGIHLTDPTPGVWTADFDCSWQGQMTETDWTCTITQSGSILAANALATQTSTIGQSEIMSEATYLTVALASATQTPALNATGPAQSGSAAASTSAPSSQSSALAAAGPLPTGAAAFVGGAAGILVAALAL